MKDAIWVFKSFGLKAGVTFVVGALAMSAKRFVGYSKKPRKFEELSEEEACQVAVAFGIFRWRDRQDLNDQFNDLNRTLH